MFPFVVSETKIPKKFPKKNLGIQKFPKIFGNKNYIEIFFIKIYIKLINKL